MRAEPVNPAGAVTLRDGLQPCPAHGDRRPSLSVRRTADGRTLVHCFAGCCPEAVLRAAGLDWADLFPGADRPRRRPAPRVRSAREEVLAHARRVQARLAPWIPWYRANDYLRVTRQQIMATRALASEVGDIEMVWPILGALAIRARTLDALEMELDALLRTGLEEG